MPYRFRIFGILAFAIVSLTRHIYDETIVAQDGKTQVPQWIWTGEATLSSAPEGSRYFRRTFPVKGNVRTAEISITADNRYQLWVNGTETGTGSEWQHLDSYQLKKRLNVGTNTIAIEAKNDDTGPAGLLVKLTYTDDAGPHLLVTDDQWLTTDDVGTTDWMKPAYKDAKWSKAKMLAPLGQGPWGTQLGSGNRTQQKARFNVPEGFQVETIVAAGTKIEGPNNQKYNISFVNLCFDAKGRLLLSQEQGPIVRAAEPNEQGQYQKLIPYCEQVRNCQGMCWVHDSLYLVGDGPKGTGLYRGRENTSTDKIEQVELVLKYRNGMGEHGPHAVIHGPDDCLYLVIGNHAQLPVDKLAPNSPLTRWPTGLPGPDQNKPGTKEDVLLPRQNDANGHAADILAPGGTIWRVNRDGSQPALVAACFRNQFDAAFSPQGELFTFDSDMEWDEKLPWYRPVRVCHCIPGADFGWRTGSANMPPYYFDTLPATIDTGRGSPTGVEFYDHEPRCE